MEPLIKFEVSVPVRWVMMAVIEGGSQHRYATEEDLRAAGYTRSQAHLAESANLASVFRDELDRICDIVELPGSPSLATDVAPAVEKLKADRDAALLRIKELETTLTELRANLGRLQNCYPVTVPKL
jgi:hypothetical protein